MGLFVSANAAADDSIDAAAIAASGAKSLRIM
jgi:hypothetical protein